MFLAVGKHIHYYMVFDKSAKEYFIIAENLVKQYYKNSDEYILINIMQWEDLVGITYEPLFPFINQSTIEQKYKDQFFKVIAADFVSTEDGTGIVHIAPGFGMDDFDAVAQFLPRDDSKSWLFMPVNEYGEFTDEVPDWKGQSVFDVNKEVITRLKNEKKLIGQKSYSHSYPHCRRCETPLISRALTSRFIKEPELTSITVPNAEKIWFVPESVKNRFADTLKSAPDRNLSRNRYRGSPLPIWENQDNLEEKIVIGKLDELYQRSRTWSKNLTKHIIIRHEETDYNPHKRHDSYSKARLDEKWKETAKILAKQLAYLKNEDTVYIVSPLYRTLESITPLLTNIFGVKVFADIESKFLETQKIYQDLREKKEIQHYLQDPKTQKTFALHEKVYMDFRSTDIIAPERQDVDLEPWMTTKQPMHVKLTPQGECMSDVEARIKSYVLDISKQFQWKTILNITHKDSVVFMLKTFRDFDYLTKKYEFTPVNGQIQIRYRDNDRQAEVDLHKPYVDMYWFVKDGHTYKRIPEVMDCWFESGSMPFGQAHYLWEENSKFVYPAEFIIEWLDQTRCRFRVLHICGNVVMKQNSYNNVIANGLILAEDGKKMSKKLNNYPEPAYIFAKYWADAYRLYLLASPAVRAEPVRFSEKWVEQVYKDFTAAMINSYKFFETYAKVDNFVYTDPTVYFLRHGDAESKDPNAKLLPNAIEAMQSKEFIEQVLRVNPDVIYSSPFLRTKVTAERVQEILRVHRQKDIPIILEDQIAAHCGKEMQGYQKIIQQTQGKTVLIVSHNVVFNTLRPSLYGTETSETKNLEFIPMPVTPISNELDKWILAAIHEVWLELEKQMDAYALDGGAKIVLSFVDKLNNRFIRRSRRRFRASGMDSDKASAYTTLFTVLDRYMKLCAPFAPFIAEHIYLELQNFKSSTPEGTVSVHLEHLPISSEQYVNRELLNEIAQVRRIISLGLFIRSKNKIAVKQPLSKMEIKM
jgi:isoleucyl-tRNA synthetase